VDYPDLVSKKKAQKRCLVRSRESRNDLDSLLLIYIRH